MLQQIVKRASYWWHRQTNPILWRPASESLYNTVVQFASPGDSILEVGSGTGHISYFLAKAGYTVTLSEIRSQSLIDSMQVFRRHKVYAAFLFGDGKHIEQHFDLLWSSGIVHCLWGEEREEFVKRMNEISTRVLLFYPDTEGGTKEVYQNESQIPGVDDAKEYPVKDIPELMGKYFKQVEYGELSEESVGLPFKFLWVYGAN